MKKSHILKTIVIAGAVWSGVLSGAGCQQQVAENHSENFTPDDQPKAINRLMDAQADRGARNDATLYPIHFDGSALNSLGMTKLDSMLKDDSALPLQVWIATDDDPIAASRRESVATYLKDKGVGSLQLQFGTGPNPATYHSSDEAIKALSQTTTGAAPAAAPVSAPH